MSNVGAPFQDNVMVEGWVNFPGQVTITRDWNRRSYSPFLEPRRWPDLSGDLFIESKWMLEMYVYV